MYTNLGSVVLKDGRCAEAGVVRAPDLDWAPRIELFLKHQASIWNWQNRRMLRSEVGIDAHYYVLHRGGRLLSTMMTGEHQGVGIRGHVWTRPEERCKGACSGLQTVQMEHFLARGGRFLCLYTHHNSVAFHIYRKAGFREAEPGSGHMIFRSQPGETFEDDYFAAGATSVEPLDWRHWPTASPLFLGDFGGQVRYSWYGLVGSQSSEHALLQDLRKQENGNHPVERQVMVLRHEASQAVVGLAAWNRHSPAGTCLLDIYCHPSFWSESERLLASLQLPQAERYISYVDSTCAYKAN